MLDAEAVHAGPNLVAALHFGVLSRERVEIRAVAAAKIADANRAVGIGADFEVAARQKLVGNAHMTFAADDETVLRDLELLSVERTADADQNRARRSVLRGRALRDFVDEFCLFEGRLHVEANRFDGNTFLFG